MADTKTLKINAKLHAKLKLKALRQGIKLQELVEKILRREIK